MNIAVIICTPDPAALNIKNRLVDFFEPTDQEFEGKRVYHYENSLHAVTLYTTDTECIHCNNYDKKIEADFFLFPTKHQSAAGVASLTVHTQGNFTTDNSHGGMAKEIGISPACWLKAGLKRLDEVARGTKFEIMQEATHHGPVLAKPTMFIEIGSSLEDWKNEDAGKLIAETIKFLLDTEVPTCITAVGLGGPHYAPGFKKLQLFKDVAIGHICARHNLEHLDKELLQQALEKSYPQADLVIFDWKGLGPYKENIKKICEELGVETKRLKDFTS